jgi:signal transduction histidine kinase
MVVSQGQVIGLLRVVWRLQTYRNILYLLAAFPLGLFYFIVLITAFSVGVGTAVLGVGLFLLLMMGGFVWAMATFERRLVGGLLRVAITPPPRLPLDQLTWWRQIAAYLRRSMTWKSLAYLLIEFPFGIVSFCLTTTLLALSAGLVLYPLFYVANLPLISVGGRDVLRDAVQAVWQAIPMPLAPIVVGAIFLLAIALGLAVTVGSLYTLNGLAHGWGLFARLMLGTSQTEMRLAEARASAARERTRAERADQSRRELIVNVSHELRTPIANIRGHVESLRMPMGERLSEDDKQHYLEIVAREADRLSALVDDLLALARAEADELRLDRQRVAVGAIVEEVYQALAPLAQRDRQVTLVRTVASDLPCALVDGARLTQVLLNLARNAITATPTGGLVFIDLERADADHLALAVSDTGSGIPADELDRIFDRFYRTDASRTRATGGFGLGLSIVRDLVQAMGGSITATSTVGVGSCFRVLLPVAPSECNQCRT